VEATRIAYFTALPPHNNNDRINFENSDVEVITTHFKTYVNTVMLRLMVV